MKHIVRMPLAILAAMLAATVVATVVAASPADAQTRERNLAKVVATERAFAKLSLDSMSQMAFDRYLINDGMVFRPRAMRAADAATRRPLPPNLALVWEPEWADVSRDGDLGYTTGPWISGPRNSRATDPKFGQYLTIWRRQTNGRYLAAIDASVATPASAEGPKNVRSPDAAAYTRKGNDAADRATLLRADNDFAAASRKNGYSAALTPIAEPAVRLLRNGIYPTMSIDSAASAMKGARVTWWVPVEAIVATSGDLGYTRGTYVIVAADTRRHSGDYVRVWRRDARGAWRVAVEMLMAGS